jgi:arsenate reductase-like glutaredoxin family protein
MLYLTSFFESLINGSIDIDNPDIFPFGLNGIYNSFFQRISKDDLDFDKNIAPLFEVMIAKKSPISKVMLAEILEIRDKELKRILNRIGSLVKHNGNALNIYHKSLIDWLVSNSNSSYPIDVNEGNLKIGKFIENILNTSKFNKEYFSDYLFNQRIVFYYISNNDFVKYRKYILQNQNSLSDNEILSYLEDLCLYQEEIELAHYTDLSLHIYALIRDIQEKRKFISNNERNNKILIINNLHILEVYFMFGVFNEFNKSIEILSKLINTKNRELYYSEVRDTIATITFRITGKCKTEEYNAAMCNLINFIIPFNQINPSIFFIKTSKLIEYIIDFSKHNIPLIEKFIFSTLDIIYNNPKVWETIQSIKIKNFTFISPTISNPKTVTYGNYYMRNNKLSNLIFTLISLKSNKESKLLIEYSVPFFFKLSKESPEIWDETYTTIIKKQYIILSILSKENKVFKNDFAENIKKRIAIYKNRNMLSKVKELEIKLINLLNE